MGVSQIERLLYNAVTRYLWSVRRNGVFNVGLFGWIAICTDYLLFSVFSTAMTE